VNNAEWLPYDPTFRLIGPEKIWDRGAAMTFRLPTFETEMPAEEENFTGLARLTSNPESQSRFSADFDLDWPELMAVALIGVAFTTAWAVLAGQDMNWDLRNYHYYTVYTWLHRPTNYDVAPAQVQNWLNPLVYFPYYWLIRHCRPMVAGAIFGGVAGLNFVLVYALARLVVPRKRRLLGMAVGLLSASIGFSDPIFLEGLGTTYVDLTLSLPILGGLLALCWASQPQISARAKSAGYCLAGMLLGLAGGLKLTSAMYALGLTLSLLVLWPILRFSLGQFSWYALGGLGGFLVVSGYWSWHLWTQYGNPTFPYWNNLFHSSWAPAEGFQDARFLPRTFQDALSYPFRWFIKLHTSSELPFRDARWAILTVLLPLVLIALAASRFQRRQGLRDAKGTEEAVVARTHFLLIVVFFITSYAIWIRMFAIQRYLIPLGLICGLVIFLVLDRLLANQSAKFACFTFLALFCMFWTQPGETKRLPYGQDWFGLRLTGPVSAPDTLFIMMGDVPASYIVPFLPASDRVVRISANFPLQMTTGLGLMAMEVVTQHKGPVRSLTLGTISQPDQFQLARFGLDLSETGCLTFRSRMDQFTSCPLVRFAVAPMLAVDPPSRTILWNSPDDTSARVYVQKDSNPKILFAEGSKGDDVVSWIVPGHRFVFELFDWTGTVDGRLLATVTIDEQGNVSGHTFMGTEIPGLSKPK